MELQTLRQILFKSSKMLKRKKYLPRNGVSLLGGTRKEVPPSFKIGSHFVIEGFVRMTNVSFQMSKTKSFFYSLHLPRNIRHRVSRTFGWWISKYFEFLSIFHRLIEIEFQNLFVLNELTQALKNNGQYCQMELVPCYERTYSDLKKMLGPNMDNIWTRLFQFSVRIRALFRKHPFLVQMHPTLFSLKNFFWGTLNSAAKKQ